MCLDWIVQWVEDERENLPGPEGFADRVVARDRGALQRARALLARLMRRQRPRQTRFVHGVHPRSSATGIRRRARPPQRSRRTLEDLRPVLMRTLRTMDEMNDAEQALELEEDDIFGPMPPAEHVEEETIQQFLTRRRLTQDHVKQLQVKIDDDRIALGPILSDIIDGSGDEIISEAFNRNIRAFYEAFRIESEAKQQLDVVSIELHTAEQRLERQLPNQANTSKGWRWNMNLYNQRLDDLRSRLRDLQDIWAIRSRILGERGEALFSHDTTRNWVLTDQTEKAVKLREQYVYYLNELVVQRQDTEDWKRGYSFHARQQPADTSPSELARGYRERVSNAAKNLDKAEKNFLLVRRLALEAGATILELPANYGDDDLSEPGGTIAGDETESETAVAYRNTDQSRRKIEAVGSWVDQIPEHGALGHEMLGPVPSDISSRDWAIDENGSRTAGSFFYRDLKPEDAIDDRELRPRVRARIQRDREARDRLREMLRRDKLEESD